MAQAIHARTRLLGALLGVTIFRLHLLRLGLGLCLTACVPPYKPPSINEPHAVLKLRRAYKKQSGTHLAEMATIDGRPVFRTLEKTLAGRTARTDVILVHPLPVTFTVAGTFSHPELRRVEETYYVLQLTTDFETYECGSLGNHQTCTRPVLGDRSVPITRSVLKMVDVIDGACSRGMRLAPGKDRIYLLEFTYQDSGACALSCFEQIADTDGAVEQRPCG